MKSLPKIILLLTSILLLTTSCDLQTTEKEQKPAKESFEKGAPPSSSKQKFMFLINSDPQMGDQHKN